MALPCHLRDLIDRGVHRRSQGYRGRFAPSPTGALHRGNLRTALIAWLDARLHGGEWILRIDDLDVPRNRPGAETEILSDLRWLGLGWDGPVVRQSERRGLYASVLSSLRRGGWLYPCRCSRRLLADVSAPHGGPSVYPGHCRGLPLRWGWDRDRLPSWRLRVPGGPLRWPERFAREGFLRAEREVGDVVLRRADGLVAYHLATAFDELSLGISDVVRGDDLWSSTGAQVAVMGVLGAPPPRYGHVPLWCDPTGRRLSKREGAEGLAGYRARGLDAAAVIGELAASLDLVPACSRITAAELLQELRASMPAGGLLARRRLSEGWRPAHGGTGADPGGSPQI